MTLYASIQDMREWIKSDKAVEDKQLLWALNVVSRRIDRVFVSRRPVFAPWQETRKIRVKPDRVNSVDGTLLLDAPLLSLTSVTAGSTALTLNTQVQGFPDTSQPPWRELWLAEECCRDWYYYAPESGAPYFVSVSGLWGQHSDYANAWASLDALGDNINNSTETIPVADADGIDEDGFAPRFSVGQLIQIDSEMLRVKALNVSTNALTAQRGVNGSTAAAHSGSAAVKVWRADPLIRHETARQAGLIYSRMGAYTTVEVAGMSEVRYPADLLTELLAVLQGYQYEH